MFINLPINPQKATYSIVQFIKKTLKKTGFSKLVVGLSGGVDSAASLALGIKAIGAENIYVGIFPYGVLNKEGVGDTQLLVDNFNIPAGNLHKIDIKHLVDSVLKVQDLQSLNTTNTTTTNLTRPALAKLRLGNIMARIRMVLLYDMSKKYNALVLGTENKTEHLLGYFTRFGDEASDIEPLLNLYKSQVKQLALYLSIPEKIIKKTPTAGMWVGQTDENEFGFTYEEADQILYLMYDKKYTKEAVIKAGFGRKVVEKVIKRVRDNVFKHKLPYTI